MRKIMSEWTPIAPFFVTARHGKRQPIFRGETTANLLIETRAHHRAQRKFLLHEFVLMRNQVLTLLTPAPESPLAPAMLFIRGGPYRGPLRPRHPLEKKTRRPPISPWNRLAGFDNAGKIHGPKAYPRKEGFSETVRSFVFFGLKILSHPAILQNPWEQIFKLEDVKESHIPKADPLPGSFSDRISSLRGRRRIFAAISILPLL